MWVFANARIFIDSNVFINSSFKMETGFINVARIACCVIKPMRQKRFQVFRRSIYSIKTTNLNKQKLLILLIFLSLQCFQHNFCNLFRNSSKHFPTNVNLIYLTFDISFSLVVWELPSEILSLMYFLVDFVNYICRVRITFLIFIRSSFDLIQLLLILYAASMRHLNESNFAGKKRPVYVLS